MTYYKVIAGGNVIDANTVFLKWQDRHRLMLVCDASEAQYIQSSDGETIWHVDWLNKVPADLSGVYENVSAEIIEKEEYDILREMIDSDDGAVTETQEEEECSVDETVSENDDETLVYLRNIKLQSLSKQCNMAIEAGIDVMLSDGMSHHIDMGLKNQINMMELRIAMENGAEEWPLLMDDDYIILQKEDMALICEAENDLKITQISYYHSLRDYVESLSAIEDISNVSYGMDIPREYWNPVYERKVGGDSDGK